MTKTDRLRWDRKYASRDAGLEKPHALLLKHRYLLSGGNALDVACGRGQNALWLGEIGYTVLGVDISRIALRAAKDQAASAGLERLVRFEEVDLNSWAIPRLSYDLVIVFRFLDRMLFPLIKLSLRPGGLLLYATRHEGILDKDPTANPDYLLNRGELVAIFQNWEIIYQQEGAENAEIVARKPVPEESV